MIHLNSWRFKKTASQFRRRRKNYLCRRVNTGAMNGLSSARTMNTVATNHQGQKPQHRYADPAGHFVVSVVDITLLLLSVFVCADNVNKSILATIFVVTTKISHNKVAF